MNSVPKTIYHVSGEWQKHMETYNEPYYIMLGKIADGIMFWSDNEPSLTDSLTIAIFRVYPKGQNPMSLKRAQAENYLELGIMAGEMYRKEKTIEFDYVVGEVVVPKGMKIIIE